MKLNLLLVAAAVAEREIKFDKTKKAAKQAAKAEKKGLFKKNDSNQVRSMSEPCDVTFARGSHLDPIESQPDGDFKSQPILNVESNGTSGHIDMDNYPNSANCYVDVVADCDRITAKIIHAGLEPYCGGNCNCDSFWFNDESSRVCGCGGNDNGENPPHNGDGCHDMMAYYDYSYEAFDGLEVNEYGYSYYQYGNWQDRVFNEGSFRLNFESDGTLWGGNVRIEWSCTEEPAPIVTPTDAFGRLEQLLDFSHEFLDNQFPKNDWLSKWKGMNWKIKFRFNVQRMKRAFLDCGETDLEVAPEPEWESYDKSDPSNAIDNLTTGFIKWTDIYLANCNGQRTYKHQLNRMNKWNLRLKEIFEL